MEGRKAHPPRVPSLARDRHSIPPFLGGPNVKLHSIRGAAREGPRGGGRHRTALGVWRRSDKEGPRSSKGFHTLSDGRRGTSLSFFCIITTILFFFYYYYCFSQLVMQMSVFGACMTKYCDTQ